MSLDPHLRSLRDAYVSSARRSRHSASVRWLSVFTILSSAASTSPAMTGLGPPPLMARRGHPTICRRAPHREAAGRRVRRRARFHRRQHAAPQIC
jgi:hypothetical protein